MFKHGWKMTALALAAILVGWLGLGQGGKAAESAAAAATASGESAVINTITVQGTGLIMVDPDIAYVNAGVETRASTASEAQKLNAEKFAAVEQVLKDKYGLSGKDVQTTGFHVYPEYDYTERDGRKLVGYVAVHNVKISMRKLDQLGGLLDAISQAGVNRMDGVTFGTEKSETYELEALKKAMANADAKAQVLASSAKKQVKEVINIVQGGVSAPPVLMESVAKLAADASGAGYSTSVQPGQIEIRTSVTVQYRMQ
jgi:hypothetical protein